MAENFNENRDLPTSYYTFSGLFLSDDGDDSVLARFRGQLFEVRLDVNATDACSLDGPTLRDDRGYSPIHHAVCRDDPEALQQLLKSADKHSVNKTTSCFSGVTPILLLLDKNDSQSAEEMLRSLLAAGADPNFGRSSECRCNGRESYHSGLPLLYALRKERWQLANILLDAEADPLRMPNCFQRHFILAPLMPFITVMIDVALKEPHVFQRLLDKGGYHPNLFSVNLSLHSSIRCEENLLHLYNMLLPYHCAQELDIEVLIPPANAGYYEVVILLLSDLNPGIKISQDHTIFELLSQMMKILTLRNYRRFLRAYFRFLKVNNLRGAPYVYLLYTAKTDEYFEILLEESKQCHLHVASWRMPSEQMYDDVLLSRRFLIENSISRWDIPARQVSYVASPRHCNLITRDMIASRRQQDISFACVRNLIENETGIYLWRDLNDEQHIGTRMGAARYFNLDFDLMSAAAYRIASPQAFGRILPKLLQLGMRSSPLALASFILKSELDLLRGSEHSPEFHRIVAQLSSDCCSGGGSCWFREPFFLMFCHQALRNKIIVGSSIVLLQLLYLGVDIQRVFLQSITYPECILDEEKITLVNHFDPRPMKLSPPPHPEFLEGSQAFDRRTPASLLELSRHAVRSAAGFCRMEEKMERLKCVIPKPIADYVCFKDKKSLEYFESHKFFPHSS